MSAWGIVQALLLTGVLVASTLVAWRHLHPGSLRRSRRRLALALLAASRPRAVQRLGRWLAPRPPALASDCGRCPSGGCGAANTQPTHRSLSG